MDSIDQSGRPRAQRATEDLLSFDLLETLPPPLPGETYEKSPHPTPTLEEEPREAAPLTSEEELLRDLFAGDADEIPAATITELLPAELADTRDVPNGSRPDATVEQSPPTMESAALSSEAYVSLRSLEGLEELEDVPPPAAPSVRPHTEVSPGFRPGADVQAYREPSPTEQRLLHLTRSVEQLTAVVFQLQGTIQMLAHGLQSGAMRPPVPAAPAFPGYAADPGYQSPASAEAAAPARRTWEPAPPPTPRETPEQWSERLEKFFDAPLPVPVETPSAAAEQDSARKLACTVLNSLNSHNMKSLDVRVEDGGVVVLKGRVISENLRYLATVVAQRTPGCLRVVNDLTVSEEPESGSIFGRYWKRRTRGQKRLHLMAAVALLTLSLGGYWAKEWLRPSVVPATGIVEIDGQPVDGARLVLHPVLGPGQSPRDVRYPTAVTDGQGKFDFTTYKPHDGIPPGDYHVSIEWRRLVEVDDEVRPGPNLLPAHFLDPDASGIHVKIARDTRELPPITLKW